MVREIEVILQDLEELREDHLCDWFGYSELIERELNIYKRIKPHKKQIYKHFPELIRTYEELEKVNKSYN
jgi:hypothetical protein